jgi:hypothetical protein
MPIHDESQIQVYWNAPPEQLQQQKQHHFKAILQTAMDRGMTGALIRNNNDHHLDSTISFQTLSSFSPSPSAARDFTLCVPAPTTTIDIDMAVPNIHINILFEYRDVNDKDEDEATITNNTASLAELISQHVESRVGTATSIGLFQKYLYEKDPILVAANVASVLDVVGDNGGGLLWLLPPNKEPNKQTNGMVDDEDDDALVALCQELAYLDVTGPTMKSRLVVDASSPDQVEECLFMGINKFVLSSHSHISGNVQMEDDVTAAAAIRMQAQLDWLQRVVQDQGKTLLLSPS